MTDKNDTRQQETTDLEGTGFHLYALRPINISKDENYEVYKRYLDEAFSDHGNKNIAITGVYGSGKSSVWNTYVEEKNINQIKVSIGQYCTNSEKQDNEEEPVCCRSWKPLANNDKFNTEERIEKQIINQIICQIDAKNIPKSKYKIKTNDKLITKPMQIILAICISYVIVWWTGLKDLIYFYYKENFWVQISFNSVIFASLVTLVYYAINQSINQNKMHITQLRLANAEAKLESGDISDESILDKDMKELIYILANSKKEVAVFEDLDRYDNISIFTKLRELNFMTNQVIGSDHEPIRFVYLIKDGLFDAQERLKFFDCIVPILPIVDSSNSCNLLLDMNKKLDKKIQTKTIYRVLLTA